MALIAGFAWFGQRGLIYFPDRTDPGPVTALVEHGADVQLQTSDGLTLQAWRANVERAWPALDARYDERFRRMWRFYLAASMATFRTRRSQLWQLVLSNGGVPGGYVAAR